MVSVRRPIRSDGDQAVSAFAGRCARIGSISRWERAGVRNSPKLSALMLVFIAASGCHSDVHRQDRPAAEALREIGARLEVNESGRVTSVIVSETRVDDGDLESLADLDKLEVLHLENTGITDAGLQYVRDVTTLREISLYGTHVTSAGLEYVRGLTNLRSLGLNETEVNNVGLKHLAGLKNLENLWLDGTAISDAGLQSLTPLKQLRNLGLRETQVTQRGVQFIKRQLPKTTVHY